MTKKNQKNLDNEADNDKKKYVRVASYEKKCVECGKTFIARSEKGEYCSRACQYQARKKRNIEKQKEKEQKIAIGMLQQKREQEMQMQMIQNQKAEEQTEKFIQWCREHPLLVTGALFLGGLYLNEEIKKTQKRRK